MAGFSKMLQFLAALIFVHSTFYVESAQALQIMLKTQDWYCFGFNADMKTILDIDYLITGINPEDVSFEAVQDGKQLKTQGDTRSAEVRVESKGLQQIDLCWKKKDSKSKKLDFSVKRNIAHSQDAADVETLDSLSEDLKLLQDELEAISRNIQKQKDIELEHFQLAASSATTQTWMSIFKMLIVLGICMGQIYMITNHFQGSQNKRH